MSSCVIALIILGAAVVLFVTELLPMPVTALAAAIAMAVFGVIPFSKAFAGFGNDVTIMVIGAMVVGLTLMKTGVANLIGNAIVRLVGTNERLFILACIIVSALLSSVLSDTAVVAMMLPVVAATAAKSNGLIKKKNVYMAIGFASNLGGGMTLIGSTPNVIANGLLSEAGYESFGFFDFTLGAIPRLIFMLLFYGTIGYSLQKRIFNFEEAPDVIAQEEKAKHTPSEIRRMLTSASILFLMIIGFVSGIWTLGTVAIVAALLCIISGCVGVKEVFAGIDWGTIWVLAGSFGLASGIGESGAGELIANGLLSLLGEDISVMAVLIMFTVIAVIMGNLASSSASTVILGPIAISLCQSLGYPVKPVLIAIVWGLNLAFMSPVATPPITMTTQGGYRFLDYTKIGSILVVGCFIVTIAFYKLVFNL